MSQSKQHTPTLKLMVSTVQDEDGRFDLFYEDANGKAHSMGRLNGWAQACEIARMLNSQQAARAALALAKEN